MSATDLAILSSGQLLSPPLCGEAQRAIPKARDDSTAVHSNPERQKDLLLRPTPGLSITTASYCFPQPALYHPVLLTCLIQFPTFLNCYTQAKGHGGAA